MAFLGGCGWKISKIHQDHNYAVSKTLEGLMEIFARPFMIKTNKPKLPSFTISCGWKMNPKREVLNCTVTLVQIR